VLRLRWLDVLSPTDNMANVCVSRGNCVVDSDCGGRYCSPSPSPWAEGCTGTSPAYYCHTALDTCIDDSDCVVKGNSVFFFCALEPPVEHWACTPSRACPP
jgi:hypothetical protein